MLPEKILGHLETLKVSCSPEQLDHVLHQAEQNSWSYLEFLEAFLSQPAQSRRERSVERRIRDAHFPGTHTLEQFDWAFNAAAIDRVQIEELATGDFIRRKDNLLMVGNSGVGKSHLLEGIGRRACALGYRVLYALSEQMLAELGASLADGTTLPCVRSYLRPELLIIAGFGFDRIEREQSPQALNLLYKVIDQRNTKHSTALITNVEFEDWNQYLSDGPMVMALLDRLFDHAMILRIDGKSYRAHRARRRPPPGPKKPAPSSSGAKAKR
jgi:DNA replication protein DnaC